MRDILSIRSTIIFCLIILLSGCAGSPVSRQQSFTNVRDKQLAAAHRYLKLTQKAEPEDIVPLKLKACDAFLKAEALAEAENILVELPTLNEGTNLYAELQIIKARLNLLKREFGQASTALQHIWSPKALSEDLQIAFFTTRAELKQKQGQIVNSVEDRIYLSSLLDHDDTIKENNQLIWQSLSQLTPNTLRALQEYKNETMLSGWIAFAYVTKQYDSSSDEMLRAFALWQQQYPHHPAATFIAGEPILGETWDNASLSNPTVTAPQRIALLLPLQGEFAETARAIRDGFLAAYYQKHPGLNKRPEVQVYDTKNPGGILEAYQQAIRAKVDFIVGPLTKEEVDQISKIRKLEVPVLALNTLSSSHAIHKTNFFQFGLPPEVEAQAVAARAIDEGYRRVLMIVPDNQWGSRIESAFRENWLHRGGIISSIVKIDSQTDLNEKIRQALNIHHSEERAKSLQSLGLKFAFEPRRRTDPDFVFMATTPTIARQVKPLLDFNYAENLPIYATSSIYDGKFSPRDQDLNGIVFCDMPWVLDQSIASKQVYQSITTLWPKSFHPYRRLYALGIDAYKITQDLGRLVKFPELGVSGMTGMLSLKNQHTIQRHLSWAVFKQSRATLLTELQNQQQSHEHRS